MADPSIKPIGDWLVQIGEPTPASEGTVSSSAIYRHVAAKAGFPSLPVTTVYELFKKSVEKYPNNKCLGHRPKLADGSAGPFEWATYSETAQKVEQLASGMKVLGAMPKSKIGVLGINCPDWMIAMQVCQTLKQNCQILRQISPSWMSLIPMRTLLVYNMVLSP